MVVKHSDHDYDGFKVGLGVGLSLLAFARILAAWWFCCRKRRRGRAVHLEDVLKSPGRAEPSDAEDRPDSGGERTGTGEVPLGSVAVAEAERRASLDLEAGGHRASFERWDRRVDVEHLPASTEDDEFPPSTLLPTWRASLPSSSSSGSRAPEIEATIPGGDERRGTCGGSSAAGAWPQRRRPLWSVDDSPLEVLPEHEDILGPPGERRASLDLDAARHRASFERVDAASTDNDEFPPSTLLPTWRASLPSSSGSRAPEIPARGTSSRPSSPPPPQPRTICGQEVTMSMTTAPARGPEQAPAGERRPSSSSSPSCSCLSPTFLARCVDYVFAAEETTTP